MPAARAVQVQPSLVAQRIAIPASGSRQGKERKDCQTNPYISSNGVAYIKKKDFHYDFEEESLMCKSLTEGIE